MNIRFATTLLIVFLALNMAFVGCGTFSSTGPFGLSSAAGFGDSAPPIALPNAVWKQVVPPPTGNAATDLANIKSAISKAQAWQATQPRGTDGLPPLVAVALSPGVYRACDDAAVPAFSGTSFYCLNFQSVQNVQFIGDDAGSEVRIVAPYIGTALIKDSKSVTFANLTFDYETAPFLQGTVASIGYQSNGVTIATLNLRLDPISQNFADIGYNQVNSGNFVELIDRAVAAPKKNVPSYMPLLPNQAPFTATNTAYATLQPDQTWQVRLDPNLGWISSDSQHPLVAIGDRFVFKTLDPRSGGIMVNESDTVTLSRVTIYGSASLATAFVENTGALIEDHVTVAIRPGSGRLISSDADGAHFQNNRGPITVQYSDFEAMADDAMAIYSIGMTVASVANNQFVVNAPRHLFAGDAFQFLNPATGAIRGKATATLASEMPCPTGSSAWVCYTVTADALPSGASAGDVLYLYNAAGGSNVLIHDNRIADHRGNGILLNAPGSRVLNNQFVNSQTGVVMVGPFLSYYGQGPVPDNVLIQGNVIDNGGIFYGHLDNGSWSSCSGCYEPQIQVTSVIPGASGQITGPQGPTNVVIQQNLFTSPVAPAIQVDAGDGIQIASNQYASSAAMIRVPGPAVLLNGGSRVSVSDFHVANPGSSMTSVVEMACPLGASISGLVVDGGGSTPLVATDKPACP